MTARERAMLRRDLWADALSAVAGALDDAGWQSDDARSALPEVRRIRRLALRALRKARKEDVGR